MISPIKYFKKPQTQRKGLETLVKTIQDPIKPLERSKKVNLNYWLNPKTCWVRGPIPEHQIIENESA